MSKPLVGILMGSDSDLPIMEEAAKILKEFDIPYEITISSAHRSPKRTSEYARGAADRGIKVIIAGAGSAIITLFLYLPQVYLHFLRRPCQLTWLPQARLPASALWKEAHPCLLKTMNLLVRR